MFLDQFLQGHHTLRRSLVSSFSSLLAGVKCAQSVFSSGFLTACRENETGGKVMVTLKATPPCSVSAVCFLFKDQQLLHRHFAQVWSRNPNIYWVSLTSITRLFAPPGGERERETRRWRNFTQQYAESVVSHSSIVLKRDESVSNVRHQMWRHHLVFDTRRTSQRCRTGELKQ